MRKTTRRFGSYDYYGLKTIETDDGTYAVGTKAQAEKAAKAYILDSLWAFRAEFIARVCKLSAKEAEAIKKMQSEMSEDANPLVRRIIGEKNLDRFVKTAIKEDGLKHFIARYDNEERRSDDVPGLPKGKLAFRVD